MLKSEYKSFEKQHSDLSDSKPTRELVVDYSFLNFLGINEEAFKKVFNELCKHWWDSKSSVPDCEGKRFIQCALLRDLKNPVKLAVIADDLEVFKKYFQESEGRLMLFELSCMCGSENILNKFFLASEEDRKYLCRSDNSIAYVLSSGKKEFALQLAEKAKALGRKKPGPLSLYSLSMQTLFYSKKIEDVFSPKVTSEHSQPSASAFNSVFTPRPRQTITRTEGADIPKILGNASF